MKRDSENETDSEKVNIDGKDVTYQQYMDFLENEMGEESQESIMRQEELKERKNKIIQLLNGEISDEDNAIE